MSIVNNIRIIKEIPTYEVSSYDSRYPGGLRICDTLDIDDCFSLSVQASEGHLCTPRALVSISEYTHFEMALLNLGGFDFDYRYINDFSRYEDLMRYKDGSTFSYVPKDLIEEFYNYLMNRRELRHDIKNT